jgi:hypothetical protein
MASRIIEITTPLGPDVLLFHTLHGHEGLSRMLNTSSIC